MQSRIWNRYYDRLRKHVTQIAINNIFTRLQKSLRILPNFLQLDILNLIHGRCWVEHGKDHLSLTK
jgi:hypothetical protein